MIRIVTQTMGGLGIWALWFVVAYGLHGAQCAGTFGGDRATGQSVQIVLWLVAAGGVGWFAWRSHVSEGSSTATAEIAQWSNRIALAAMLFTGAAVFLIRPC